MNTTTMTLNRATRRRLASRRARGYGLLEIGLGIGLMALALSTLFHMQADAVQTQLASAAASRLDEVNTAANAYLKANYAPLLAATAGGTVVEVRVGRPSASAPVPAGSLQSLGFLPDSYVDTNAFRQAHTVLVRQPSPGTLEMLVHQVNTSETSTRGGHAGIPDTQLGQVVLKIGAHAGARLATVPNPAVNGLYVSGLGGGWRVRVKDWIGPVTGIPQQGTAAMTTAMNGAGVLSDYLYRYDVGIPEANKMHAPINMNGNDVNAAKNVTATGQVLAGRSDNAGYTTSSFVSDNGGVACAGNATGCKFWISDDGGFEDNNDGWIRYQGTQAGKGLVIEGAGNNLLVGGAGYVGQTLQVGQQIGTQGYAANGGLPAGSPGGLHTYDVYAEGTVAAGQGGNIAAYMNSAGDGYMSGNTTIGQNLSVGKNATIGGMLGVVGGANVGGDIYSGRRIYAASDIISHGALYAAQGIGTPGNVLSGGLVSGYNGYMQQDLRAGINVYAGGNLNAGQSVIVGQDAVVGGNVSVQNGEVFSGRTSATDYIQAGTYVAAPRVLENGSSVNDIALYWARYCVQNHGC